MKKVILNLTLLFITTLCVAQPQNVFFKFDSVAPDSVLRKMERNAKAVFEEINNASREGRTPSNVSSENITEKGKSNLLAMWETSSFYCTKPVYDQNVNTKYAGNYEVRNISVYFSEIINEADRSQDIAIEFTKDGKIDDIFITLKQQQYAAIMETGNRVGDSCQREYILDVVEQFRTAYTRQDVDFLEKMFNDEALIISGNVIRTVEGLYSPQYKKQYIDKLKKNSSGSRIYDINVDISQLEVVQYEDNPNFYLVKLWQKWDSKYYSNKAQHYKDESWLTLVIQFPSGEPDDVCKEPIIWVRVWEDGKLKKNQTYNFTNFFINKLSMKKFILNLTLLFITTLCVAQPQNVFFKFNSTAPDYVLRKMEQNAKAVFEEINNASREGRTPSNVSSENITEKGKSNLLAMWETSSFYCTKPAYNQNVNTKYAGNYEVRNISVFYSEIANEADRSKDIVIEFTKDGTITNFSNAIKQQEYVANMETGNRVGDLRQREYIVDVVEQFRTAYTRQDVDFIEKMFNDEALIISGNVIRTAEGGYKTTYKNENKKEYIKRLKDKIFKKNSSGSRIYDINVDFSRLEVVQDGEKPNYYLVKLWQKWDSKYYSNKAQHYKDEGWLTLVIQFPTDEPNDVCKEPTIWVRAWEDGQLKKNKTYTFKDFNNPSSRK